MLVTASQTNRGHSGERSPLIHLGQCRRGSLETRESVSNSLSKAKSFTAHASTPPGSWTRTAGPRTRIRAASPWISRPVGSTTKGPSCGVISTGCLQARVGKVRHRRIVSSLLGGVGVASIVEGRRRDTPAAALPRNHERAALSQGSGPGFLQGAADEDAGQVLAEAGTGVEVGRRLRALGRPLGRLADRRAG